MEQRAEPGASRLLSNPPLLLIGVLLGTRILIAGLDLAHASGLSDDVDIRRFTQIANAPGRPYRDLPVEYMPVELVAIHGLVGESPDATLRRIAVTSFACELLAFGALWYGWGRRAATIFLAIGLPLLTFQYLRIDALAVAFAVWGFALVRRGRDGPGGALLAVAVLTKVWPIVLLPALAVERRVRALAWASGALVAGIVIWLAYGGVDALRQVGTFRGATGWEVESTIGDLVWIVTGGPIRLEQGSTRTGVVPGWARVALWVALLTVVIAIWRASRERRGRTTEQALGPLVIGGPSLAAVGALLALSPLFSLQYAIWLVPWAALAATRISDERLAGLAFVAIALTGVISLELSSLGGTPATWEVPLTQIAIVLRDGACLALPLTLLARRGEIEPR